MSPTSYQAAPPRDILLIYIITYCFFCQLKLLSFLILTFPLLHLIILFKDLIYYSLFAKIFCMKVDFSSIPNSAKTVAVALSGGSDSMALFFYAINNLKDKKVVALNVEHGIRGLQSLSDSLFVKDYCEQMGIELLSYSVDAIKKATEEKLSIEQSARMLRYECFFDAINTGKTDVVLTAHHERDTAESVLFNLFRGTGLRGVCGINDFENKIIRPLSKTTKDEINEYVVKNSIPFCTDQTNFDDDYSRNYIRLNVLPVIKKAFPEAEKSIARFSTTAKEENEFLERLAKSYIIKEASAYKLKADIEPVLFKRAVVNILKELGNGFDYEKKHIDIAYSLKDKQNGAKFNLKDGIEAFREYEYIVFAKNNQQTIEPKKLEKPITAFLNSTFEFIDNFDGDLTKGLYLDADKLPSTTVVRTKLDGDMFTKFGGGTKKLCDYLTDKKIPKRKRDDLVLLADGNTVYAIAGVAVSELSKVTTDTKTVIKISTKN